MIRKLIIFICVFFFVSNALYFIIYLGKFMDSYGIKKMDVLKNMGRVIWPWAGGWP